VSLYHLKHTKRSARTRTLIQLGGLLVKSGLVEKLGIELGTDLQQNSTHKNKAYALLGLLTYYVSIPQSYEDLEKHGREAFDNILEDGESS
jgi:hypothetical protein